MVLPVIARGKLVPGMAILDMACGRGRHAGLFAKEGFRVTGIDLSETCIHDAARLVPEAIFEVFDIRKPYAQGKFDAVVCLFTSLGYTGDRKDDDLAVAAAAQALRPGGLFVLDLMNGELVGKNLVPLEIMEQEGVKFQICRALEKGDVVKRITVEHDGQLEHYEERVHAWSAEEVKAMVARAGFLVEAVTDGTCEAIFDPGHSDRIVIWARTPA